MTENKKKDNSKTIVDDIQLITENLYDSDDIKESNNDVDYEINSDSDTKTVISDVSDDDKDEEMDDTKDAEKVSKFKNIVDGPFTNYQKLTLAAVFIATNDSFILDADLEPTGEFHDPLIKRLVHLLTENMKVCTPKKKFMQGRGDGTNRNKFIMKYCNEEMYDQNYDKHTKTSYLKHSPSQSYYDLTFWLKQELMLVKNLLQILNKFNMNFYINLK